MKIKKKTLKLAVVGIISFAILVGSISYFTGKEDPAVAELAQCLTDKGAKMYGAFWCGACHEQKKLFGNTFKYIDYIECDSRGDDPQPELCQIEGISGYPTWKINGQTLTGVRSFEQLAGVAGCEYGI